MEKTIKKLILATVFAAVATTAIAGGMSEPVMEAPVVASIMVGAAGSATLLLISLALIANPGIGNKLITCLQASTEKGLLFQWPFFH